VSTATDILREHLDRVHKTIFCHKCKLQFKTEAALQTHVDGLDPAGCRPRAGSIPEGFGPDIANKLKIKTKTCQTNPERWKDIFRMLFPGIPVPTPCESPKALVEGKSMLLDDFTTPAPGLLVYRLRASTRQHFLSTGFPTYVHNPP
jgi:hypothetical protein